MTLLMTCLALLALLVSVPWASASVCSDAGGTCKSVSLCSSTTVSGLCPGGTDIRCCFPGQGSACSVPGVGSGKCLVQGYQTCSGAFYSNLCAGPAKVKCCAAASAPPAGRGCSYWTANVALPASSTRNPGMTALSQTKLTSFFGKPCSSPAVSCANKGITSILSKNLRSKSSSPQYSAIPFEITMVKPAMDALQRIFSKVKAADPDLYAAVKTAGALCCRPIKKADGTLSSILSLHSWGVALDLTICTKPADRGSGGSTYRGIVALAPYFRAEGFYWGAAFQDAMHWEVSSGKFDEWVTSGALVK